MNKTRQISLPPLTLHSSMGKETIHVKLCLMVKRALPRNKAEKEGKGVLGTKDIISHGIAKECFSERLITLAKCPQEIRNKARQRNQQVQRP